MMDNPAMRDMMVNMMSSPGVLDSIAASNPMLSQMLAANPALRTMMTNPESIRAMLNPQAMQAAMRMQQVRARRGAGRVRQPGFTVFGAVLCMRRVGASCTPCAGAHSAEAAGARGVGEAAAGSSKQSSACMQRSARLLESAPGRAWAPSADAPLPHGRPSLSPSRSAAAAAALAAWASAAAASAAATRSKPMRRAMASPASGNDL